jgi:hypothetical protein
MQLLLSDDEPGKIGDKAAALQRLFRSGRFSGGRGVLYELLLWVLKANRHRVQDCSGYLPRRQNGESDKAPALAVINGTALVDSFLVALECIFAYHF